MRGEDGLVSGIWVMQHQFAMNRAQHAAVNQLCAILRSCEQGGGRCFLDGSDTALTERHAPDSSARFGVSEDHVPGGGGRRGSLESGSGSDSLPRSVQTHPENIGAITGLRGNEQAFTTVAQPEPYQPGIALFSRHGRDALHTTALA
jgi:hypothetical protein